MNSPERKPTGRILLVDDNPDNTALLSIVLEAEGFRISTASSGQMALELVARQPPHLMLLDWIMPDINGYEVTRLIKGSAATQHVPIIILSGMDDQATRLRAKSAGAAHFLTKPIDLAELRQRVRELLSPEHAPDVTDALAS